MKGKELTYLLENDERLLLSADEDSCYFECPDEGDSVWVAQVVVILCQVGQFVYLLAGCQRFELGYL